MPTPNVPRKPHAQAEEAARQAASLISAVERPTKVAPLPKATKFPSSVPGRNKGIRQGPARQLGSQTGARTPKVSSNQAHRGGINIGSSKGSNDKRWRAEDRHHR